MLPNYYPQATITNSAPDAVLESILTPALSGLVHEVPAGEVQAPAEISSDINPLATPESSWDTAFPEAFWILDTKPIGDFVLTSSPVASYNIFSPTATLSFTYPIVNEFLKFPAPLGALHKLSIPTSRLSALSTPIGQSSILSTPTSAIFIHRLPTATVTNIFYTPVLALDEGFLWLDDGGRLEIGY